MLTTGHVRDSFAGEVSEGDIAVYRDLIEQITASSLAESVPIPGCPGYSVSGRANARCLTAVVHADASSPGPVCTIGISTHSRCGARLWRSLHTRGEMPVVTDPDHCPAEPWAASAQNISIVRHPAVETWLDSFERCLACAWLRLVNDRLSKHQGE